MSFAVFVFLRGESPATNALRFATTEEAQRAGEELLSRWFAPTGFEVREMADDVNYEFLVGQQRPKPLGVPALLEDTGGTS